MRSTHRFQLALALAVLGTSVSGIARADILEASVGQLYGGDGILLDDGVGLADPALFQAESAADLQKLVGLMRKEFRPYDPMAPQGAFTYDFEEDKYVRSTTSFGPISAERAETIGRRRFNFGFLFATRDLKLLEGEDTGTLRVVTPAGALPESGRLVTSYDVTVEQDFLQVNANYGITDRWEVGLLVPFGKTRVVANALSKTDEDPQFPPSLLFCSDRPTALTSPRPNGCQGAEDVPGDKRREDSGWGIGDIVLRTKYHFLDAGEIAPDLAFIYETKFATGRRSQLRGDGQYQFTAFAVASRTYAKTFTPHVNLGIEATTGPKEFHAFRYRVGYDARVLSWATLAMDILGRTEFVRDGFSDDLVDVAVGFKVNPWRKLVLTANARSPLNRDTGFRAKVEYAIGVEYYF